MTTLSRPETRTLVTGGCGFIGSAVVNKLLGRGEEVLVLDDMSLGRDHWRDARRKPEMITQDILDFDGCDAAVRDFAPTTIIHLAAHHFIPFCEEHAFEAHALNVQGTLHMLECARRNRVQKFFLASSGDVYSPSLGPNRECDQVAPIYVYGRTKLLAEELCARYFESDGGFSTVLIGRLFNATGPRETNPHLLAEVTRQIAVEGKRSVEVGNLWPLRDYVDVESMAEAIIDATAAVGGFDVINFGSGQAIDVREALRILTSVLPFQVDFTSATARQRPNDRPYLCPDTSRLHRAIGRSVKQFGEATARGIFAEHPSLALC
jgi:UDP-glucose 4-epimerase